MRGDRETGVVNVLVSVTLICTFVYVYSDIDVLKEILHKILCWCAVALASVLLKDVLQSRMDVFRDLSRELCHRFNSGIKGLLVPPKRKRDLVKRINDGVYQVNVENIGHVIYDVAPREL
ncbi:hypothetical protein ACB098_10G031400 [Castanea mollissima]